MRRAKGDRFFAGRQAQKAGGNGKIKKFARCFRQKGSLAGMNKKSGQTKQRGRRRADRTAKISADLEGGNLPFCTPKGGRSFLRPPFGCFPLSRKAHALRERGKILLCLRRDARAALYRLPCRCVFTETASCFLYIIVAQARKGRAICGQVRRCPLPAAPPTPARRKRRARR